MGLDIRLPIGLMFLSIGGLLALYGVLTGSDNALYARSLGTNLNLWWGIVMFVFGALMAVLGRRAMREGKVEGVRPAEESVEGRRTEKREHRKGLEH